MSIRLLTESDVKQLTVFYRQLKKESKLVVMGTEDNIPEQKVEGYIKRLLQSNSISLLFDVDGEILAHLTGERSNYQSRSHVLNLSTARLKKLTKFIKYPISPELWRNLIERASMDQLTRKLECQILEDNTLARSLITKFKFSQEGIRIDAIKKGNKFVNEYLYGRFL